MTTAKYRSPSSHSAAATCEKVISSPKNWDEYFVNIMLATAARSKDPNTKVGAVIVDADNKIVSCGYNGFPPGVKDLESRWTGLDENGTKTKYKYVVHAEMNAIFNSSKSVAGCRLYVPFWPCSDCAKNLIAAGIKEVIIVDKNYYYSDFTKDLLEEANVKLRTLKGKICTGIKDTHQSPLEKRR